MKRLVIIGLLISGGALQAQHLDASFLPKEGKMSVSLSGYGGFASDGIGNAFVGDLLFDDVLDADRIDDQIGRLEGSTVLGGDYRSELHASLSLKASPWSLRLNFGDVGHLSARFGEDLFGLVFKGNKSFAGSTAELSESSFQWMRYQKLGFGAAWHDVATAIAMDLSFINGQQMVSADLDRGELYTSEIGDTLRADVNARLGATDSTGGTFAAHNGGGFGVDMFFSRRFAAFQSDWEIQVQVRDLGWVQWHPGGEVWNIDTIIEFTGIEVNDLSQFGKNNTYGADLSDSVSAATSGWKGRGTQESYLPGWAQFSVRQRVDKGVEMGMGVVWRWATQAKTYAWLESAYRFNEHWVAGAELGYGGFGKVQVGLGAEYTANALSASVRIMNAQALIIPTSSGGLGASIGVRYRFGK
ncbi:MAG: hypothetical protein HQ500_02400 [Flavobacteriales bacterium]|nr:hypothetical protein [Flavobacteriales bacterium]